MRSPEGVVLTANNDLEELSGRDPHAVLGVRRGVSRQEVVKAFRRSAAQGGHPDLGGDDRTFRQLSRARDVLLDSRRLTEYNAARQAAGLVHVEARDTRRRDSTPRSSGQPHPHAQPRPRAAPAMRTETRPPSAGSAPETTNNWAIITVLLVLLGPLLWPAAIVTGHLALWRTKRAGNGGGSHFSGALAVFFVVAVLALPSLVLFAVIMLS